MAVDWSEVRKEVGAPWPVAPHRSTQSGAGVVRGRPGAGRARAGGPEVLSEGAPGSGSGGQTPRRGLFLFFRFGVSAGREAAGAGACKPVRTGRPGQVSARGPLGPAAGLPVTADAHRLQTRGWDAPVLG